MARHKNVEHGTPDQRPAQIVIPGRHVRTIRSHLGLAGLSMCLLGMAFPPLGWSILAHVALVPMLLLALLSTSGKRVFWTCYLACSAWWLIVIAWAYPVTPLGYVLLALYMALYWAMAMVLVRFLNQRYRPAMVLAFPLVWVSLELIRGNVLQGGFGWYSFAQALAPLRQGQGPGHLIQVADLFGEYGVMFLVAMTTGIIVDLLYRPWFKPVPGGGTRLSKTLRVGALAWLAAMIGAWTYGRYRIVETERVGSPGPTVAVIQTNVPQSNKEHPTAESEQREWQKMLDLSREAGKHGGVDLIAWPETMVPASLNDEAVERYQRFATDADDEDRKQRWARRAAYRDQIAQLARDLHAQIIAGADAQLGWHDQDREGKTYIVPAQHTNSAFLFRADGTLESARYDKIHRVPFGEYMPWVENWDWGKRMFLKYLVPSGYQEDYTVTPGSSYTLFTIERAATYVALPDQPATEPAATRPAGSVVHDIRFYRVVTPICFEDTIGRACRQMVYDREGNKRADVLINLTNDGWFTGTAEQAHHLQNAVLRCIENRVPMARSVNTGVSAFIDSTGRVEASFPPAGEGFLTRELALDRRRTLWGVLGLWPATGTALATAALLIGGFFRRKK